MARKLLCLCLDHFRELIMERRFSWRACALHTAHCGESWSHSCPLMCCPFFPFFVKHSSLTTHTPVSPACLIGSCQYVLVPVTRIKRISSHGRTAHQLPLKGLFGRMACSSWLRLFHKIKHLLPSH